MSSFISLNRSVSVCGKQSDSQTILNEFLRKAQGRRRSALLPGVMFQRRRRSSHFKGRSEVQNIETPKIETFAETDEAVDEGEESKDLPEVASVSTVAKKSSFLISSAGQGHKSSAKSYKLSKGPVDLMLRRAARQYRKQATSRHDLPTVKAELTSDEKRKELLSKFRRCIRLLIHVRVLLNVSRIRIEEEEKSKGFKRFDGGLELSFDAAMFKCAVSYSGLTSRARQALKKNPEDRTEEDAKILMVKFCFPHKILTNKFSLYTNISYKYISCISRICSAVYDQNTSCYVFSEKLSLSFKNNFF